jgi:hypothetical protein
MIKTRKKFFGIAIVIILLFITIVIIYNALIHFNIKNENSKLVNVFRNKHSELTIKDYEIGDGNTIIKAVIIYYDKETDSNSNVAIITEKGTGFINLSADDKSYTFASNEKIVIVDKDTVKIPLFNSELKKIVDFMVSVTDNVMGSDYVVESKIRD